MYHNILVTGATDGIGLELAHRYYSKTKNLFLLGRRPLLELDPHLFTKHNYCRVDLRQGNCGQIVKQFLDERRIDRLDLLIHNAGTGWYGPLEKQPLKSIYDVTAVNLIAPISLTHALLAKVKQARGKIVFVSSAISQLACPKYLVYSTTKAAIDGFVRSLRIELAGKVDVQLICPGATLTGLHAKIGIRRSEINWERFTPASKVADRIVKSIKSQNSSKTIGLGNSLIRFIGRQRHSPLWLPLKQCLPRIPSLSSKHNEKPLCVITGAAVGIGKSLAEKFGQNYRILGIDWDQNKATKTSLSMKKKGMDISFLFADLSQQKERIGVLETLRAGPKIRCLVHNAGINQVGHFTDSRLSDQLKVLEVNLLAPLILSADLLSAGMFFSGSTIVLISSLSHYVSYPGAAVYAASKDGLASLGKSLDTALTSQNMNVLTVFPGPTRTMHARKHSPNNSNEAKRMDPKILAKHVHRAVSRRHSTLVPGIGNQFFAILGHHLPRLAEITMQKVLLEKL